MTEILQTCPVGDTWKLELQSSKASCFCWDGFTRDFEDLSRKHIFKKQLLKHSYLAIQVKNKNSYQFP